MIRAACVGYEEWNEIWNMPLAHSDGVFGATKLRSLKGKLGRNAVPTFGPDLVMDDTH